MNKRNIVIVEKAGTLKSYLIKDFNIDYLFKKCGFKKSINFELQHVWNIKMKDINYYISVYAKCEGKSNFENKYDFPPPIDNKLFFGNCAIVLQIKNSQQELEYVDLTISLWEKIYEHLFGGFEDLVKETEYEVDELDAISKNNKTKDGYLKDNFVIDSGDDINEMESNDLDLDSELSEDSYSY